MSKRLLILMCSIFLIVPLLMMGCGSDGSNGAAGTNGTNGTNGINGAGGAAGPPGPVTNTNESCMVCHTTGRIADIKDTTGGVHYDPLNTLPTLTVDNIVVTDNTSGNLIVSFTVKIDNNAPYTALADNASYFFAADLVPAGTVATDLAGTPQSTAQFERWAFERTGTFNTAFNAPTDNTLTNRPFVFGTLDKTGAATGRYTYTFATPLGSHTVYDNAVHFNIRDTQRVYIRVAHTVSNTYTGGAGFEDFTLSGTAPGYTVTNIGYLARQFVTIEACQKCHGPKNQFMDHGSSYMDINGCVICHSQITNANNGGGGSSATTKSYMSSIWFGNLIHRIHLEKGNTLGKVQPVITYPRDIRDCVVCHSNPSGKALGAGDLIANWENHPTTEYCGTCHIGFPLTSNKGGAHGGGTSQPDSACGTCHPASGSVTSVVFPVATVHDTSPEPGHFNAFPPDVPEFNVTLSLTAPANGTFYVANENVTITATLKSHADNTTVNTKWYTNPQGAAGITDNALRSASLAAYGPRALPKPILGLPLSSGLTPQTANLFIGSKTADNVVNARVLTDNTGFRYKLTIPSGLASGTYGVRVRFGDYGYVTDNNYKTESVAFQLIQIGSATVTKKVAGDGCTNCHGVGQFLDAHDARHAVIFDTDQCISCHDYSGNHASALSNRVHAIHDKNTFGDMLNTRSMQTTAGGFNSATIDVNWSGVTYPQNISNCATCHTSGNTSYRSVVHEVACLGCHGDNIYTGGSSNHMLQNGGDWPTP